MAKHLETSTQGPAPYEFVPCSSTCFARERIESGKPLPHTSAIIRAVTSDGISIRYSSLTFYPVYAYVLPFPKL